MVSTIFRYQPPKRMSGLRRKQYAAGVPRFR